MVQKFTNIIDYWSIAHFIVGILFGFIFAKLKLSKLKSFLVVLLILLFWEIFEIIITLSFPSIFELGFWKVETISNKIGDIIIGYAAFSISYLLNKNFY